MTRKVIWDSAPVPRFHSQRQPVFLSDQTMKERRDKILTRMAEHQLDCLAVYCDLEHGSNFEYLTGFLTRFEESVLLLFKTGRAVLLLGNENTKMVHTSRIPATMLHVPFFSLPNQPMTDDGRLCDFFTQAGIESGMKIGVAGWKLFTSQTEENSTLFDVPSFIVEALRQAGGRLINATGLFIDPRNGARITNNANELIHYEYGASLASDCVLRAMEALAPGKTELEIGSLMNAEGQRPSVVTIFSTGDRFEKANLYPRGKAIQLGDKLSLTTGYKGGLTSRAGYAVSDPTQLPEGAQDYLEKLAMPYYAAVAEWLETIHVGLGGGELYEHIERVLPKSQYHWSLNPGHLSADEEWLCSPITPGSTIPLASGMLFQIDIIPSLPGYGGTGAESTVALADEALRCQIEKEDPVLWETIRQRRAYIQQELGIVLHEDVLPMCDTVAYYRPLMLNREKVLKIKR